MSDYFCTFERVGRSHTVEPLTVRGVDTADELAFHVYTYVRPKLASRDVEVSANLETMEGRIFCGFRIGGTFKIEQASP